MTQSDINDNNKEYIGYHATDKKWIDNIIIDGFRYKTNPEHWLGQGYYFFLDYKLAEHWTKVTTKKYGIIENPAYIKVKVSVEPEMVIDTLYIEDFEYLRDAFTDYCKHIANQQILRNHSIYRLRCSFFDWFRKEQNVKVIICSFSERNVFKENSTPKIMEAFNNMNLVFREIQMCVYDNEAISYKSVYEHKLKKVAT